MCSITITETSINIFFEQMFLESFYKLSYMVKAVYVLKGKKSESSNDFEYTTILHSKECLFFH